jgi:hypothetical protein
MNTRISPRRGAGAALDGGAVAHRVGRGQHPRAVLAGDRGGASVEPSSTTMTRRPAAAAQARQRLAQALGFVLGRKDDRNAHAGVTTDTG